MNNPKVNTKISLDELVLKVLYYRYKIFFVPVGTIGICILLCIFLIVPQFQSYLAMQDTVSGDSQKLAILKQNLQTISNFDDSTLDSYLSIATSALPAEKDFAGVLRAISTAAASAGSILGDYSFQIGDISADPKSKQAQLPLQLSINLKGDLDTARRFIEELKNQLPLSDISSVSVNSNGTIAVAIVFYYAPLPKITFDDSLPLIRLSTKEEATLKLLNDNQNGTQLDSGLSPTPEVSVTPSPTEFITSPSPTVVSATPSAVVTP